jgi:hypothetical protein
VVDIEDAARDVEAAGKAAAPKSFDPKAEEALDAKVKEFISSLGEDFSDAYYALADLPENAIMGKPLVAAIEELDKSCDSDSDSDSDSK